MCMHYHSLSLATIKEKHIILSISPKNCLSSYNCHIVKIKFFISRLLHANVQCACNMKAKNQIATSKAVVGVGPCMYYHNTSITPIKGDRNPNDNNVLYEIA